MTTRTSIYFDEPLHQALRLKAATIGASVSELVNEAVREALREDAEDLSDLASRGQERSLDFATVVKNLKTKGLL